MAKAGACRLSALAILSTLFLVADQIDPEDALPFAEVDVEDLAREPRMTLRRAMPERPRTGRR